MDTSKDNVLMCEKAVEIQELWTHKVRIEKVDNGFIVKVGCKTFVETSWDKVNKALDLYWKDPAKAEKRYCK